jgi:hypothetical protein
MQPLDGDFSVQTGMPSAIDDGLSALPQDSEDGIVANLSGNLRAAVIMRFDGQERVAISSPAKGAKDGQLASGLGDPKAAASAAGDVPCDVRAGRLSDDFRPEINR